MTYERFEDLPVWQTAADLAAEMFSWTVQPAFRGKGDLANQLQRAALSISNNIAEGFERGTTAELLTFLYYARGSAGEVRSMLSVIQRISDFKPLDAEIPPLKSRCESISRQLRGWANSLQNSEITGQRHLTDRALQDYRRKGRRRTFRQQQAEFMAGKQAELEQAAKRRAQSDGDPTTD